MRGKKSRFGQLLSVIVIVLILIPAWAWSEQNKTVRILTLEQCLGLALKYNPTIHLNLEKIQELIQDYNIARAGP
jgi:hypothetical protein